ncbi:hypothetical protein DFH28DRAFT_1118265 [Melampsora americana]|nr:hypothetical protein DFH28DRAFT_1118265 [Melampsora americana]
MNSSYITFIFALMAALTFAFPLSTISKDSATRGLIQRNPLVNPLNYLGANLLADSAGIRTPPINLRRKLEP